jgi:hypothetical protein
LILATRRLTGRCSPWRFCVGATAAGAVHKNRVSDTVYGVASRRDRLKGTAKAGGTHSFPDALQPHLCHLHGCSSTAPGGGVGGSAQCSRARLTVDIAPAPRAGGDAVQSGGVAARAVALPCPGRKSLVCPLCRRSPAAEAAPSRPALPPCPARHRRPGARRSASRGRRPGPAVPQDPGTLRTPAT